jgi:hypothetical protein
MRLRPYRQRVNSYEQQRIAANLSVPPQIQELLRVGRHGFIPRAITIAADATHRANQVAIITQLADDALDTTREVHCTPNIDNAQYLGIATIRNQSGD